MNKLLFSCGTITDVYSFYADWSDGIVKYEIEEHTYSYMNKDDDLNEYNVYEIVTNGKLNKENSLKFIELLKKAEINDMEFKIKEKEGDVVFYPDLPFYKVSYINGEWIEHVHWNLENSDSIIEEQKYIFMALMLCDYNTFEFLSREILETEEYSNSLSRYNKPFVGNIQSFYFSGDEVIQYIEGNQNQQLYENIDELKNKLENLFTRWDPIKYDDAEWEVILINENDEIFTYWLDKGLNKEFDDVVNYAKEFVNPLTTTIDK